MGSLSEGVSNPGREIKTRLVEHNVKGRHCFSRLALETTPAWPTWRGTWRWRSSTQSVPQTPHRIWQPGRTWKVSDRMLLLLLSRLIKRNWRGKKNIFLRHHFLLKITLVVREISFKNLDRYGKKILFIYMNVDKKVCAQILEEKSAHILKKTLEIRFGE